MFFGGEVARYPFGYISALLVTAGTWFLAVPPAPRTCHAAAMVLFFGPCWWFLCLAPLVVVGYESTRHVYLASVGWAIIVGLVFHTVWQPACRGALRNAGRSGGIVRLLPAGLQAEVADWKTRARVSQKSSLTSSVRPSRHPKEAC